MSDPDIAPLFAYLAGVAQTLEQLGQAAQPPPSPSGTTSPLASPAAAETTGPTIDASTTTTTTTISSTSTSTSTSPTLHIPPPPPLDCIKDAQHRKTIADLHERVSTLATLYRSNSLPASPVSPSSPLTPTSPKTFADNVVSTPAADKRPAQLSVPAPVASSKPAQAAQPGQKAPSAAASSSSGRKTPRATSTPKKEKGWTLKSLLWGEEEEEEVLPMGGMASLFANALTVVAPTTNEAIRTIQQRAQEIDASVLSDPTKQKAPQASSPLDFLKSRFLDAADAVLPPEKTLGSYGIDLGKITLKKSTSNSPIEDATGSIENWTIKIRPQSGEIIETFGLESAFVEFRTMSTEKKSMTLTNTSSSIKIISNDSRSVEWWTETIQSELLEAHSFSGLLKDNKNFHVKYEGYLAQDKKGAITSVFWCTLTDTSFEIRRLRDSPVLVSLELKKVRVNKSKLPGRELVFIIKTAEESYDFQCLNAEYFTVWMTYIERAILEAKGTDNRWTGYLTEPSKSYFSWPRRYFAIATDGHLSLYHKEGDVNPVVSYSLSKSTIRSKDRSVLIFFSDGTSASFSVDSNADVQECEQSIAAVIRSAKSVTVIKKGYLHIRKFGGNEESKKVEHKWIVLSQDILAIFKSPQAKHPEKVSKLVKTLILVNSTDGICDFSIELSDGEKVTFQASDESQAKGWKHDIHETAKIALHTLLKKQDSLRSLVVKSADDASPSQGESAEADIDMENRKIETDDDPAEFVGLELDQKRLSCSYLPIYETLPHNSKSPIVFDNGAAYLRVGLAEDEIPAYVFPSAFYKSGKDNTVSYGYEAYNHFVGEECSLSHIFSHNKEIDWESFISLYDHCFRNILRVDPREHKILLTEPPNFKHEDLSICLQILFETFEVPSVIVHKPAYLPLYAFGETTGLIVDIGTTTTVTAVYDNILLQHASTTTPLGGFHINQYLYQLMNKELNVTLPSHRIEQHLRPFKERHCYTALSYDEEIIKHRTGEREPAELLLSEGRKYMVGDICFRAPELLFKPSLAGLEYEGIPNLIKETISKCAIDTRRDIASNIILIGGTTSMRGFHERLELELERLQNTPTMKLHNNKSGKYLTWIGGAYICQNPEYDHIWMDAKTFQEGDMSVTKHWGY